MAAMVDIVNNGTDTYTEEFRDEIISIPAGGKKRMPRSEANIFLSTIAQDQYGRLKPKPLSAVPVQAGTPEAEQHVCMFCGVNFETKEALEKHAVLHEANRVKEEPKPEEPQNGFKCPFCEYKCNTEQGLKAHLTKNHMR